MNSKIEVCLEMFEKLNGRLEQIEDPSFKYFNVIKDNLVKVLNNIVEHYVLRDPKKASYEGHLLLNHVYSC